MANSNYVSYTYTGHGKYATRKYPISKITIHHLACVGGLSTIAQTINNNSVSWNYGIDSSGKVGLFVPENYRAYSTGSDDNDNRSVNIVVCNSSGAPDWYVTENAVSMLIELCIDICKRNNITKLVYTGIASTSNLTLHRWFDKKVICPGPDLFSRIEDIVYEVNYSVQYELALSADQKDLFTIKVKVAINDDTGDYLSKGDVDAIEEAKAEKRRKEAERDAKIAAIKAGKLPATTDTSISYSSLALIEYTIKWEILGADKRLEFPILDYKIIAERNAMHPYLATLSSKVSDFNASKLNTTGVIGLMLYAGTLFNNAHETVPYVSATLKSQVQLADNANLPFGLYASVRANNLQEARYELSNLYQVASKYPPELGIWLCLEMDANRSMCDSILSEYYKCIERWGLSAKCGLYVTSSQLDKITWSKFEQYFMLNLVDHIQNVAKMDEVLVNEFFNM